MYPLVLIETEQQQRHFRPFTAMRPFSHLRMGMQTFYERWQNMSPERPCFIAQFDPILALALAPPPLLAGQRVIALNAAWLPQGEELLFLDKMPNYSLLSYQGQVLAFKGPWDKALELWQGQVSASSFNQVQFPKQPLVLHRNWDFFRYNQQALSFDFQQLTKNKISQELPASCRLIGPREQLFIHQSAKIEAATLNTLHGPIYLDAQTEVMEGSLIRGGFFLGQAAVLKMGAKVYGPSSIGPNSKVGGEINNSVIMGMSNKAHDGFLGNSVIGFWCNLGADTNNSNLKNNYGKVKVWNQALGAYECSKLQFCGLFMGDHSKAGINTMFNTGTWVGLGCNVYGAGFLDKFLPDFTWGAKSDDPRYDIEKFLDTAQEVKARRNLRLTRVEMQMLRARHQEALGLSALSGL